MKRIVFPLIAVATLAGIIVAAAAKTGQPDEAAASIDGGKLPSGYRDWRLISVAHEEASPPFWGMM